MKANFEKGTKICSKCKRELPIDHFQKDKSKSDGLNTRCKDCVAEYRKSPRGKEVASEARRKYYQTEKGKECQRRSTQKLQKTEHGKEIYKRATKKYRRSEQGIRHELERRKSNTYREVRLRYIQSEKGKKALKRGNEKYEQSEKGKKVRKYIYMKRILNGRFNEYQNKKYKLDKNYRIGKLLRTRLWSALKNNQKSDHTLNLLGCSIDELKAHLEMQFEPGMTWDNLGKGEGKWQIDHIIPCSYFDLTKEENQRICFNYRNLQPLWAKDNLEKSNSVSDNIEELVEFLKQEINENIC